MVVAIISMLAALLMPALKSAKESAKATTCVNNLRQIYFAVLNYSQDHDGKLPPYNSDGDAIVYGNRYWSERLSKNGYIPFGTWFCCPSFSPNKIVPPFGTYDRPTIYGMRTRALQYLRSFHEAEGYDSLANILYLADSIGYNPPWDPSQRYYLWGTVFNPVNGFGYVHKRHNGTANCLILDGHVSGLTSTNQMGWRAGSDFTTHP